MGLFGGSSKSTDTGRTSAQGGNGNVRDSSEDAMGGPKHKALLGGHAAAMNDLRPDHGYQGRHFAAE